MIGLVPATDAIIIGHSQSVPVSPRHSPHAQSDLSGGQGQVGPAFYLCPEQVLTPSESISWASPQASSPRRMLHLDSLRHPFLQCAEGAFSCPSLCSCQRKGLQSRGGPVERSQMAEERPSSSSPGLLPSVHKETHLCVRKG